MKGPWISEGRSALAVWPAQCLRSTLAPHEDPPPCFGTPTPLRRCHRHVRVGVGSPFLLDSDMEGFGWNGRRRYSTNCHDGPNWILAGHIVKVKGRKQELLHPVKFEFMA